MYLSPKHHLLILFSRYLRSLKRHTHTQTHSHTHNHTHIHTHTQSYIEADAIVKVTMNAGVMSSCKNIFHWGHLAGSVGWVPDS